MKVLLLSDLGRDDEVRTPSRRLALVKGFCDGRVKLQFTDDGEECELMPHLLRLVKRAKPHCFPAKFFNEHAAA